MIRNFNTFQSINENKYEEYKDEHDTLGEYVEYLQDNIEDKERFAQILGKYLKADTDVRISNAVNVLPEVDQRFLIRELERELGINESVETDEIKNDVADTTLSGKWGFNSFIKVITALGIPDIKPDFDNCPKDFAIYYSFNNVDSYKLSNILGRFRSLKLAKQLVDDSDDEIVGVYFGLKSKGNLFYMEYGLLLDDVRKVFGEFKFGKRVLGELSKHKSKSLVSLKEELSKTSLEDLKILMKVKSDLSNLSPGFYYKKSNPAIKDNVLIQGYYGLGSWEKGMMKSDTIDELKSEFKEWILTQRWRKKVLFSVKADKFWVYFKIKVNRK